MRLRKPYLCNSKGVQSMATTTIENISANRKWGLRLERYYPLGFAVIAAAVCLWLNIKLPSEPSSIPIYLFGSTVTFGAIVSGFVGTALSILTALATPLMKNLRNTRRYILVLRNNLGSALASGIMLSCTSIVGMWLYQYELFLYVWCFMFTFCLACLFRLARNMLFIFSDPRNSP